MKNWKKTYFLIIVTFVCNLISYSQKTQDSLQYKNLEELDEISISISSFKIDSKKQPQQILLINPKSIELAKSQTTAEVLENTGEVYLQKTQTGGGSPILRGFEANKILLMIDGIRLNNSITRGGHTQQAITVDNGIVDKTEVLFGSSSVLYGTDALGGSINFYTKNPIINSDTFKLHNGNSYLKFGSANFEKTFHTDFTYGNEKLSFISSFTYTDFDNLTIGKNSNNGDWGKQIEQVKTINDIDSIINNSNPYKLENTGYSQWNALHKTLWNINEKWSLKHTFIYTSSSNIHRYDKLTVYNNDKLKYAEWYYGPQEHMINAIHLNYISNYKLFDNSNLILSNQQLEETRNSRLYRDSSLFNQKEEVNVYSATIKLNKQLNHKSNLNYGYEFYHNNVYSSASFSNIYSNEESLAPTRFPNGNNNFFSNGVFASYSNEISKELLWTMGVRFENINYSSSFIENGLIELPYTNLSFSNQAITGNTGINYHIKRFTYSAILSKGFRSPNLDDYGKIRAKNGFVTLPTNNLKPEQTYSFESTVRYNDKKVQFEIGGFYTYLLDAITRKDGSLNGVDSIFYDGEWNRIQFNANTNKATLYGMNIKASYNISENLSFYTKNTYTYGWDKSDNVPLGHIPPLFGKLGLNCRKEKIEFGMNTQYNIEKEASLFSPTGVDNLEYALTKGAPSWYTLNVFASYTESNFNFSIGVDNILNQHIRTFSSGVSRAGISGWAKVNYMF